MLINLSPAEVGVICNSISLCHLSGSPEYKFALSLIDEVRQLLPDDVFRSWLFEFDLDNL